MNAGLLSVLIVLGFFALMIIPTVIVKKKEGKTLLRPAVQRQLDDRKRREADMQKKRAQGIACCPFCGGTSLSANKRGYKVGRGLFWALVLGGAGFWLGAFGGLAIGAAIGMASGGIGSQTVYSTCLSCGRRFRAGQKTPGLRL